jgi:two-component system LytT family sensor kinase
MGRTLGEWPHLNNLTPHFFINFFWAAIIFYLFYFYFFQYFEKQEFIRYLIFSVISSVVIAALLLPLHKFFNPRFEIFNLRSLIPPVAGTFLIAQSGCLIRGFENWFTNIQLQNELETRNLRNELELLKSQINPHFLFNSLNNIDSLIRSNPDNASNALITLSEMLRYMIYETNSDKVLLNKEIVHIKNYIKLQQLRFREKNYVNIIFPTICDDIRIAPMLLIPFIENAFKYAISSGKLPVISIQIKCNNNVLTFSCRNKFKRAETPKKTGGVGLENVKRRLDILYSNKFNLSITEKDSIFKVDLSIRLI